MNPTLIVLAAGIGSRYGGLKQIDPIGPNGESIIDYSIFDAARAGFAKVVFVIRRNIEKEFKDAIGSRYEDLIKVDYAFQELDKTPKGYVVPEARIKPWGTGHAILVAGEMVDTSFAVINADDFYGRTAFEKISKYLSSVNDNRAVYNYSMVGFKLKNTLSEFGSVSRGVCNCSDSDMLSDIVERTKVYKRDKSIYYIDGDSNEHQIDGNEIASMNMWGFNQSLFGELETMFGEFLKKNKTNLNAEFYIPFVVDTLIKSGKAQVKILKTDDVWFGITYKEDKKNAAEKIKRLIKIGEYPEKLFQIRNMRKYSPGY